MSDIRTILVVDDDPDSLSVAESVLSEIDGVEVTTANDGPIALQKAKAAPPDLMVLDVNMPGMTGFNVFAELKKEEATRNTAVIMLTGVAEQTGLRFSADEMGEFFGEEPEAYLEKPVEPEQLLSTVRKTLGLSAN